ncbi:MAG: hypothetical protein ACK56I_10990, partial [bacterium]
LEVVVQEGAAHPGGKAHRGGQEAGQPCGHALAHGAAVRAAGQRAQEERPRGVGRGGGQRGRPLVVVAVEGGHAVGREALEAAEVGQELLVTRQVPEVLELAGHDGVATLDLQAPVDVEALLVQVAEAEGDAAARDRADPPLVG